MRLIAAFCLYYIFNFILSGSGQKQPPLKIINVKIYVTQREKKGGGSFCENLVFEINQADVRDYMFPGQPVKDPAELYDSLRLRNKRI